MNDEAKAIAELAGKIQIDLNDAVGILITRNPSPEINIIAMHALFERNRDHVQQLAKYLEKYQLGGTLHAWHRSIEKGLDVAARLL